MNVAVVPVTALRGFLPRAAGPEVRQSPAPPRKRPQPADAWREPRTLLIGVFVLCMAFTEGAGNDWLAVAVIDGYGAAPVVGPLAFAIFLAAMTVGRWFGPALIDRCGRVFAVRTSAVVALVGLSWSCSAGAAGAIVGAALWGLGAALGFPVGMSAAADDPAMAAARVSVVASIAYTAFLAGPPLIGFLGDQVGVLRSLTVVAGLLGVALLLAGVTRPVGPRGSSEPRYVSGRSGRYVGEPVGMGADTALLALVQRGDRRHVVLGQLEVEQLEVLGDPRRGGRLGEDDVAPLDVPAQGDLSGGLPTRSAIAVIVGSFSTPPWAIGDQASVRMPCSDPYAADLVVVKYGCTSTWLTAGTTSVSSANRRRCGTWKLETPMDRARPSR